MHTISKFIILLFACLGLFVLPAFSQPLFFDDFEDDLSQWVGKSGGGHHGVIVEDPLRPGNKVLTFTSRNGAGDMFGSDVFVMRGQKHTLRFDYLGTREDAGGYIGFAESTPGRHRWLTGSIFCCGAESAILIDDGQWHSYSIDFDVFAYGLPGQVYSFANTPPSNNTIKLMVEDYLGVPGDVFFDNIELVRQCEEPSISLVSWLPGDGNAYDVIDGNDGMPEGGASFEQGACGEAFKLDGIDDYVDLGNDGSLHLSSGDFTVSAWVKFNALSHPPGSNNGAPAGDMSIVDKMSDSGVNRDGWRLAKQDDNRFWFCLGGRFGNRCWDPAYTVFSQTRANTQDWFHVVAVKSSSGFAIYVNGILEDSRSNVPNFLDTNTADMRIGSYILEGAHLNGLVDEVQLFNKALNAEEIKELYYTISGCDCKQTNTSPTADAGPDRTIEMTSCSGAAVTLDGSGSYDPDGDALTYTWTWDGGSASGVNPTITLPYGTTTVTLTVDDGNGGTATDSVSIEVTDTTPPVVNVSVTPNLLWPPNHKYVEVVPSVSVSDACVEATTVELVSATSNEPDNGLGDGNTVNDIVINADGTVSLRAERSGNGSGRIYTITYRATDIAGTTTTSSAAVTVPHDK